MHPPAYFNISCIAGAPCALYAFSSARQFSHFPYLPISFATSVAACHPSITMADPPLGWGTAPFHPALPPESEFVASFMALPGGSSAAGQPPGAPPDAGTCDSAGSGPPPATLFASERRLQRASQQIFYVPGAPSRRGPMPAACILGSTGSLYAAKLLHRPASCTCPGFSRPQQSRQRHQHRHACKHILFLLSQLGQCMPGQHGLIRAYPALLAPIISPRDSFAGAQLHAAANGMCTSFLSGPCALCHRGLLTRPGLLICASCSKPFQIGRANV